MTTHNNFSASRSKSKTTGNAQGGARGLPTVGFSNFCLKASGKGPSDRQLFQDFSSGLVVKRFSGNSDPISGQFSGVAKNSWMLKSDGTKVPVQEVMIAGNLFDLLNQIVAVGSEQHSLMGNGLAPYIVVDGVAVTAG